MASGTVTIREATPGSSRSVPLRLGLAVSSCVAVAAFSSWSQSRLPAGARLAELALCVAAWEVSVAGARSMLRRPPLAAESAVRLAVTVLIASVPASAGMGLVFWLLGEPVAAPVATYGQSLALGLVLAFARRGLMAGRPDPIRPPRAAPPAADTVAPGAPEGAAAALLRRQAPKLAGRRLVALEAEDHYLRIHTDGGSALVLMRLRDAVAALGPRAGWQPHRSFWLAAGEEARVERNGQGWTLTLAGGLVVPVSRARAARMRDAGYTAGPETLRSRPPPPVAPAPPPAPPW